MLYVHLCSADFLGCLTRTRSLKWLRYVSGISIVPFLIGA